MLTKFLKRTLILMENGIKMIDNLMEFREKRMTS